MARESLKVDIEVPARMPVSSSGSSSSSWLCMSCMQLEGTLEFLLPLSCTQEFIYPSRRAQGHILETFLLSAPKPRRGWLCQWVKQQKNHAHPGPRCAWQVPGELISPSTCHFFHIWEQGPLWDCLHFYSTLHTHWGSATGSFLWYDHTQLHFKCN